MCERTFSVDCVRKLLVNVMFAMAVFVCHVCVPTRRNLNVFCM